MALIPCKECNKEISTNAIACPNCGFQNKSDITKNHSIIKYFAIGLGIGTAAIAIINITNKKEQINVPTVANGSNELAPKGNNSNKNDFPNLALGEYPSFGNENPNLDNRIKELLKDKYNEYISNFEVLTPFDLDGNILYCNAAKAHSFGISESFLIVNMKEKFIQAAYIENGTLHIFSGGNNLAKPLQEWISSTRDTETRIINE